MNMMALMLAACLQEQLERRVDVGCPVHILVGSRACQRSSSALYCGLFVLLSVGSYVLSSMSMCSCAVPESRFGVAARAMHPATAAVRRLRLQQQERSVHCLPYIDGGRLGLACDITYTGRCSAERRVTTQI
jgi:hypothetical protein